MVFNYYQGRDTDFRKPCKNDFRVSRLQRAINDTYHRSPKITLFQFMVRTKIQSPEENPLNELIEQEVQNKFQEDRKRLRVKAINQIAKTQKENERGYNIHRIEATKYKIRDIVAINMDLV